MAAINSAVAPNTSFYQTVHQEPESQETFFTWGSRCITVLTSNIPSWCSSAFAYWRPFFISEDPDLMPRLLSDVEGIILGYAFTDASQFIRYSKFAKTSDMMVILHHNNLLVSSILRSVEGDLNALSPNVKEALLSVGDTITELSCNKCGITPESLKNIVQAFPRLKHLSLKCCPWIDDKALIHLITLKDHLKSLNLTGCMGISNDGLNHIAKLTELEELYLYTFSDAPNLALLAPLTQLRVLRLEGYSAPDFTHFALFSSLTKLSVYVTDQNGGVPVVDLTSLANLTSLIKLHLTGVAISDAILAHLSHLTFLTDLNLSGKHPRSYQGGVTDVGVLHFEQFFPRLKKLNLSGQAITDVGLAHLALCKGLTELKLSVCPGITSAGFAPFAATGTLLRKLDLSDCYTTPAQLHSNITDDICNHLAQFVHLTHLNLQGMVNAPSVEQQIISSAALERLKIQLPNLKIASSGNTFWESIGRLRKELFTDRFATILYLSVRDKCCPSVLKNLFSL